MDKALQRCEDEKMKRRGDEEMKKRRDEIGHESVRESASVDNLSFATPLAQPQDSTPHHRRCSTW